MTKLNVLLSCVLWICLVTFLYVISAHMKKAAVAKRKGIAVGISHTSTLRERSEPVSNAPYTMRAQISDGMIERTAEISVT